VFHRILVFHFLFVQSHSSLITKEYPFSQLIYIYNTVTQFTSQYNHNVTLLKNTYWLSLSPIFYFVKNIHISFKLSPYCQMSILRLTKDKSDIKNNNKTNEKNKTKLIFLQKKIKMNPSVFIYLLLF
jgi:hypothetical protein